MEVQTTGGPTGTVPKDAGPRRERVMRSVEQTKWVRVTRSEPCVVCKRPDWCTRAVDGTAACCMRVESPKSMKNGGWLHRLSEPLPPAPVQRRRPEPERTTDMSAMAERFQRNVGLERLKLFAKSLGVGASALKRLRVGHDGEAWCFPMRDADGRVVGIRRRLPDGRKFSVKGGHEGLFYDPEDLHPRDQLLLPEGPTDTAALMTLGFSVIGRPSCLGGREIVKQLVGRRDCVVVADCDDAGTRGANVLAGELKQPGRLVRVILPLAPHKDVRQWVQNGATRLTVESLIRSAAIV